MVFMSHMGKLSCTEGKASEDHPTSIYIAAICSDTPDYHFHCLLVCYYVIQGSNLLLFFYKYRTKESTFEVRANLLEKS